MERLLESIIGLLGAEAPELATVDEDYGQLEMLDQEGRDSHPLVFPALLLDAPDVTWSDIGALGQKGEATVRARLLIDCYDDTHDGSGTVALIRERDALRRKVHLLLQGFRADGWTQLVRTSSRFYTANHGIKVYEQTYTGTVTELPERGTVPAQAGPLVHGTLLP